MRFDRTLSLKLLWLVYGILWVGGQLRLGAREPVWAGAFFLSVAGAIAVVSDVAEWRALCVAGAIGFAFECIGVRTGFPFGGYVYTDRLGPMLLGVPVAIACAWMVMSAFARQWGRNVWAAAGLLTATDLVIDPVASGVLGYWRWLRPGWYFGVPISNYAGWFLVSLFIFWVVGIGDRRNVSQRVLGGSILLFFVVRGEGISL